MFDVIYINFDCIFKEKISISVTTPYIDFNFSHIREIHTENVHTERRLYDMFSKNKGDYQKDVWNHSTSFWHGFQPKKKWFHHPKYGMHMHTHILIQFCQTDEI